MEEQLLSHFYRILLLCVLATACSRAGKDNSSSLIIHTPTLEQLSQRKGLSGFATIPANRKACYGVNITGLGIDEYKDSCSPSTGVVVGFVEAGKPIEAFAPRGTNRKIELFLYLMPSGETGPCPVMGKNLGGTTLRSTYLVATAENVSLLNDTETVSLTIDFPGAANSIAEQFQLAATCSPSPQTQNISFHISSGGGIAQSANHILKARIGNPVSGTRASNANYILNGHVK